MAGPIEGHCVIEEWDKELKSRSSIVSLGAIPGSVSRIKDTQALKLGLFARNYPIAGFD